MQHHVPETRLSLFCSEQTVLSTSENPTLTEERESRHLGNFSTYFETTEMKV